MEELSAESRRWLEDVLPVGRTVDPATFQDEAGLQALRQCCDESSTLNDKCVEALEELGSEYDGLSRELESKLVAIFGRAGLDEEFSDSNLPELDWLVSIAMSCSAETTDEDKLHGALGLLEQEISLRQKTLGKLKDDSDEFVKIESELLERKAELDRILRQTDLAMEAEKARMTDNVNSLHTLGRKRRQYEKASAKLEEELHRRQVPLAISSASLAEQRGRVQELQERASCLEDALRRYCGLPTDKAEARLRLDELAQELSEVDARLIQRMRDQ